jgi:hypothetical protein
MSLSRTQTRSCLQFTGKKPLETISQQAQCLRATCLKNLQNWRAIDGSDFASCVERGMAATDSESKPGPNMTLEELDEVLDRIAATSPFSSVDLQEIKVFLSSGYIRERLMVWM